jgi:hypothetical protein
VEPNDDGEAEMVNVAFTCPSKIWEQTVEEREEQAHSLRRIARLFRMWRRARMAIAEWDSRALQREQLAYSTTICSPILGSRERSGL